MTPRPDRLLATLPTLLRPLARLLVRSGVTLPSLVELLRPLFVEVAIEADTGLGRAPTDSRLSLVTGLHRKEIRRLREMRLAPVPPPAAVSLNTEIIGRWLGGPGLQDARGEPIPLPRTAPPGEPSFERLVASVTTDLRPRTVLDAWLDRGLVRVDPGTDEIRLLQAAYIPEASGDERLFFFGRNLGDHLSAACANIVAAEPCFPDASVHYDALPDAIALRLEQEARAGAARLLRHVNRLALELLAGTDPAGTRPAGEAGDAGDAAEAAPVAGRRVNLGVYLFAEGGRHAPDRGTDRP